MGAFIAKIGGPVVSAALMMLVAAGLAFGAASKISNMVDDARQSAINERDNFWKAQIAEANKKVAELRAANLENTMRIQIQAASQVQIIAQKLTEVEQQNAALPDSDNCGLGHDRVRLLNNQ